MEIKLVKEINDTGRPLNMSNNNLIFYKQKIFKNFIKIQQFLFYVI